MIELEQVQKVGGGTTQLDVPELKARAGEIAAVVGPIGSGETELIALLTGRTRPTSGEVRICGLDPVSDQRTLARHMGVLFIENGLYERMTVRANLTFHCHLHGLPVSRADEVITRVGLADQAAELAGRLAAGLARRLAFGRAILHHPDVLLLVQPFAGCDEASRSLLASLTRELADAGGAILLLAPDVAGLSHLDCTLYELNRGRLVPSAENAEERRIELPFRIPARQEAKVVLVNPADILYATVEDGQTLLSTAAGQIASHLTLSDLEAKLGNNGFFRCHRAYLVNLQRIKAVIPYTRDSYTLVLDDGANSEIPLSKAAAHQLRVLIGY